MADFKSCEGVVCYCLPCDKEVVIDLTDKPAEGSKIKCNQCGQRMQVVKPIEVRLSKDNRRKFGELTLDVDVSDALKGLKAVQREAKRTIKMLKEVEELSVKNKEV